MNLSHPDRRARLQRLASEYALGTLSPRARRRIARIAARDPIVAAALREWEWRLAGLAEAVPPVTPSPKVWTGIREQLGLVEGGRTDQRASWWSSLAFWRGLSVTGALAALALGIALVSLRPEPAAPTIVVLAPPTGGPAIVATAIPGTRDLALKGVRPLDVPAGRTLELWALPDGAPPRSLGLLPASGTIRLALPPGTLERVPALAVSLEPAGGSPTGAPTGPVLYTGRVERML